MRVGQYVEWTTKNSNGAVTNRAGKIVAVVPGGCHPNMVYPGERFNANLMIRQDKSYIVHIPIYDVLMWPSATKLILLTRSRASLLTDQVRPSLYVKKAIDRSDRVKIRNFALISGDWWEETRDSLRVTGWGKVFHFAVEDGVEFVERVELI
jgi:hypothetical protein